MRIGGRFGEPCYYPFVTGLEGFPFIFEVVKEESETVNFGGNWHSDTAYLPQPPLATLLYALEVPKHGGDTLFTSTRAAYDALSDGMRAMVDKLVGVNSAALKAGGGRSKMHSTIGSMKVHDTDSAEQYESEHPAARTHPDTGRKALYISRSHTIRFKDMSEEESRPLVDFLQAHQTRPEFTCRVRWQPGTLTIWDNRCTPAQRGERLSRPAPPHAAPDRRRPETRLAFVGPGRKRHAVREFIARGRQRFDGAGRGALLGPARPIHIYERRQRGSGRRVLHEAAIRLARLARHRADALAADEHRVAKHVRGLRDGLRNDVVLAHGKAPALDRRYRHFFPLQ